MNMAPGRHGDAARAAPRAAARSMKDASRARRRRPRPHAPARLLVQPRLPRAAPHRLEHARRDPREAHRATRRCTQIHGFPDLKRRLERDRRCFAFFHPALPGRAAHLRRGRVRERAARGGRRRSSRMESAVGDPRRARCAVFYSITSCQPGLRGISFGNFLIKQVAEDLHAELPNLKIFATLSPIPGLRAWVAATLGKAQAESGASSDAGRESSSARRLVPHARMARAARRSIRWRASTSATARASSASTGWRTRREARLGPVLRPHGELRLRPGRRGAQPRGVREAPPRGVLGRGGASSRARPRRGLKRRRQPPSSSHDRLSTRLRAAATTSRAGSPRREACEQQAADGQLQCPTCSLDEIRKLPVGPARAHAGRPCRAAKRRRRRGPARSARAAAQAHPRQHRGRGPPVRGDRPAHPLPGGRRRATSAAEVTAEEAEELREEGIETLTLPPGFLSSEEVHLERRDSRLRAARGSARGCRACPRRC